MRPKAWNKYRAVKTMVGRERMDSRLEAKIYAELLLLKKAGEIRDLVLKPRYPLIVNEVLVATYIPDFVFTDRQTGEETVLDAKGVMTPVFRLKARLLEAIYGKVVYVEDREGNRVPYSRRTPRPRTPKTSSRGAGSRGKS